MGLEPLALLKEDEDHKYKSADSMNAIIGKYVINLEALPRRVLWRIYRCSALVHIDLEDEDSSR